MYLPGSSLGVFPCALGLTLTIESLPLTDMRYKNGWIESVISYIEYNNRFVVSFGKFFAEVYFFATSC